MLKSFMHAYIFIFIIKYFLNVSIAGNVEKVKEKYELVSENFLLVLFSLVSRQNLNTMK